MPSKNNDEVRDCHGRPDPAANKERTSHERRDKRFFVSGWPMLSWFRYWLAVVVLFGQFG
jgi:hypothetical protein